MIPAALHTMIPVLVDKLEAYRFAVNTIFCVFWGENGKSAVFRVDYGWIGAIYLVDGYNQIVDILYTRCMLQPGWDL